MRAIVLMFDSLNRHMLPPYGDTFIQVPNFARLPKEPFFTPQSCKDGYPHDYNGPEFDRLAYQKVSDPAEQVAHPRYEYAALVSMCDRSVVRVPDFMDAHDMWRDTMLIVNTDHGFPAGRARLVGEAGAAVVRGADAPPRRAGRTRRSTSSR